jgi:hypothetical protein
MPCDLGEKKNLHSQDHTTPQPIGGTADAIGAEISNLRCGELVIDIVGRDRTIDMRCEAVLGPAVSARNL